MEAEVSMSVSSVDKEVEVEADASMSVSSLNEKIQAKAYLTPPSMSPPSLSLRREEPVYGRPERTATAGPVTEAYFAPSTWKLTRAAPPPPHTLPAHDNSPDHNNVHVVDIGHSEMSEHAPTARAGPGESIPLLVATASLPRFDPDACPVEGSRFQLALD